VSCHPCFILSLSLQLIHTCSIVAVHGIFESGLEAWTDTKSGILWLRDLFPHQRYNVRVLAYHYDAEAFSSPGEGSADRILPFANSLVAELCADRQLADAFKRPIIFVCHGFGGLLVKRALAFSSTRRAQAVEHLRSVFVSTYAIVFLGTPHNGVRKESLLLRHQHPPLDRPGPSQFTLNLLRGSEMLQEITDQFAPLMKRFAVYNLWEQRKTKVGDVSTYVVEEDSASPTWDNTERCGIFATHDDMIKFSDVHDHGYRVILEALARYIAAAPALIHYRWDKDMEALEHERQLEAEDLLKPPLPYLMSDDGSKPNRNEWFIIPRCSSIYFTGRRLHAEVVREKLGPVSHLDEANRHRICVIYGLGGAGKTQFCLRYAEDNKPRYWGVFWIDASSEENAETDFASLGQQMGKGATFTGGMHWLSQCTKPWLLVIDNADDPEMDVSKYFPVGGSGHILITTRNPGAEIYATVGHLRFSGLEPEDAVNLLLKTAFPKDEPPSPKSDSRRTAQKIASELGYLALALAHAGTSIRRNIYTLEMYLRHYLGHRKEMITSKSISTADQANIITTWEIPFQRIESRKSLEYRDAVDLIHISAFMHFDSIPEAVFQRPWDGIETGRRLQDSPGLAQIRSEWDEGSQFRLRTALSILYNYSIIDHDPKKGVVSLHPVIQRWAKDRLSEADQKRWLSAAVAVLAQCISPLMEASGQRFRRSLLPHIEACLRALKAFYGKVDPDTVERAVEIERFAWVFAENGLWKRARTYQFDVLKFRTKKLGRFHTDTIQAQGSLAQSNFNLFDIAPCISAQRHILDTHWYARPSFADWMTWPPWKPEHVPYCITLSDLTLSLWFAGKLDWSKRAGERAVKGLMKRLGPDDPLTLTAMFNLARTYHHLCNQRASRALLVEVLRKRKRLFGPDHPDTLMARSELGMSFCVARERLPAAERLVSNVLAARKKLLGEEHAYTLWSMNDLARVLTARQRPHEAIAILDKVAPILRRTLGDAHPGMSMTKANLTQAYVRAERWGEAETLLKELLQVVSKDHPDSIVAMLGYIYVRTATGRMEEAETDCLKVLDVIAREKVLSADSPRTLAIVEQLSLIYIKQERWNELEALKAKYPSINQSGKKQFNIWLV
jgi:Tetratricopeptide repeat